LRYGFIAQRMVRARVLMAHLARTVGGGGVFALDDVVANTPLPILAAIAPFREAIPEVTSALAVGAALKDLPPPLVNRILSHRARVRINSSFEILRRLRVVAVELGIANGAAEVVVTYRIARTVSLFLDGGAGSAQVFDLRAPGGAQALFDFLEFVCVGAEAAREGADAPPPLPSDGAPIPFKHTPPPPQIPTT
jgi:hypothetical protein